jgi:hypothetical protein
MEFARALPPQCLSGRWGSLNGTEQWLLRCEFRKLQQVFRSYLLKKRQDDTKRPTTSETVRNEPANDDMAAYSANMTKWRKDVYDGLILKGNDFIRIVQIMHDARGPLMHYLCLIEKSQAMRQRSIRNGSMLFSTDFYGPLAAIACKVFPTIESAAVSRSAHLTECRPLTCSLCSLIDFVSEE